MNYIKLELWLFAQWQALFFQLSFTCLVLNVLLISWFYQLLIWLSLPFPFHSSVDVEVAKPQQEAGKAGDTKQEEEGADKSDAGNTEGKTEAAQST